MAISDSRFFIVWELTQLFNHPLEIPLLIDLISLLFLATVSFITSRVLLFAFSYMGKEKFFTRFMFTLLLFVRSIFFLILSPRIIRLFLGWDGLGVSSYFLVIYFQNKKSFNAGLLTALSNRVGDVIFLISVYLIKNIFSWNFFIWQPNMSMSLELTILLIIARFTKRAQIPFSAWLPAAIAAPTPVSALVHSSTLVTAGVYVLFRISPIILSEISYLITITGIITILMAGIAALQENDAKKIVALSTLRQLGIIIITMGSLLNRISFFHLLSHAYFKALLFLVVGNIIHLAASNQDLRSIRIFSRQSPINTTAFFIANIRLCGIPFFSGFYSKDMCIEQALNYTHINLYVWIGIFLGILLTVGYSLRFINCIHFNHRTTPISIIKEKDLFIATSIITFSAFAVFIRSAIAWILFSNNFYYLFIPNEIKNIIFMLILRFLILRKIITSPSLKINNRLKTIFFIWNLPFISRFYFRKTLLNYRKNIYIWNERLLIYTIFKPQKIVNKYRQITTRIINSQKTVNICLVITLFLVLFF